jgi:NAD(P)-dependent dehydrogenase (short-subunit alcohol dehydrogenase family)
MATSPFAFGQTLLRTSLVLFVVSAFCLAFVASLNDNIMSHKRFILVTGGNKGIGRAVCERLVVEWPDTFVIVGSRDRDRGEQAVQDMVRSTRCDPSRLSCLQIDTSSDDSVREAAKQLSIQLDQQTNEMAQQQPVRLYGVVNNAGVRVIHA